MYSSGSMSIHKNYAERGGLVWPNRPYKDRILVSLTMGKRSKPFLWEKEDKHPESLDMTKIE